MDTNWTWDQAKNRLNLQKHGLSFETALLVFEDPLHLTMPDPYDMEDRWRTYGEIQGVLILIVHTEPSTDQFGEIFPGRIISARKATSGERKAFEESNYGFR